MYKRQMLRFMELGKLNPAPISGYEISTVADSLGFNFDMEDRIRRVEERTEEVLKDWEENYKGKISRRPRLLITGCPNAVSYTHLVHPYRFPDNEKNHLHIWRPERPEAQSSSDGSAAGRWIRPDGRPLSLHFQEH